MANEVRLVVKAKDEASGKLDRIGGKAGKLGSMMGTAMKAGALAGGAALAGAGIAAVKMGLDFGKSMAEVKTLLPELGEKGFGKLKGDVLDLSKQMGIATSEMVPALYQAISAGVPPENVIDFLRTGAKASIGGVTDLATAVDGLTTVNNAFGYSADQTGRVADVMFTAVKLGKTTMAELSASMFQAAPLAAALGLDIEDVAAATATLTKSGVPTAQAMTSMQQAMVSLTKPNADMNKLLAQTGYESGKALLEAKGLSGGLQLLTEAAGGNETEMAKAFGSVEALKTVLGLTGENAEIAASDLDAVTNSAGASQQAFDTMADTASHKLNKAINFLKVSLTELGLKALPYLMMAAEKASKVFKEDVAPVLKDIGRVIKSDVLPHVIDYYETLYEMGMVMAQFLAPAIDTLRDAWENLGRPLAELLLPILKKVGQFLLEHKPILIAVAAAILLLTNPWLLVAAAILVVLAKWDAISAFFIGIGNKITGFIDDVKEIPIIGAIFEDTFNTARAIVETAFELIVNRVQFALDTIKNAFAFWKAIFTGDWKGAWNALKAQAGAIWNLIKGDFGALLDGFKAILGSKLEMLKTVGADIAKAIGDGLRSALGWARGAMNALITIIEKGVNYIIGLINAIPDVSLPFGMGSIGIPDIPRVSMPRLQRGGIIPAGVTTAAILHGPEAVIPLDRGGAQGAGRTIVNHFHFDGPILGDELQAAEFAEFILPAIRRAVAS